MPHTISLVLAQALQAAGVQESSAYAWRFTTAATWLLSVRAGDAREIPAYTSDELLALLGADFLSLKRLSVGAQAGSWVAYATAPRLPDDAPADTPAEALGRLLLAVRAAVGEGEAR